MFTFILQSADYLIFHRIGLFLVFFIISWAIFFVKIIRSGQYKQNTGVDKTTPISIIIPVVDEPMDVWADVLDSTKTAANGGRTYEIIVVANGPASEENAKYAEGEGLTVIRLPEASKRMALLEGSKLAKYDISILLDSDTIFTEDAIEYMLSSFEDLMVGGVTPRHLISGRGVNLWRRLSDWLEDIRFNEVVKGQSVGERVACLPGRAFAIRTGLFRDACPSLVSQRFLGAACISGDDTFLTSYMLERGYKTVYDERSIVLTEAPDSFKGLVKQRLRWARTSLRETIRSLKWAHMYPYMLFTTLSAVIMRWFFFVVMVNAVLYFSGIYHYNQILHISPFTVLLGTIFGFFANGLFKQLRHLIANPSDLPYLPIFLLFTTFVLTPIEWYGNITMRESGWMTRDTN